jgi:hypothetical protein
MQSNWSRYVGMIALIVYVSSPAVSQIEVVPTLRETSTTATKTNPGGRSKTHGPLHLPFWDDFSTTANQFPDPEKWLDSEDVWINDGMAINAPTKKVATFDGLDKSGLAYNPNEILVTGYTDELTSQPIDLSESSVLVAERPGVYLSFFYQWQGNGEAPDRDDYLEVEFRAVDTAWQSVMVIFPRNDFERSVFYDTTFLVSGDQFFHDKFQIRFRSFGRQSGPFDTWNIDYVYLNKARGLADTSFPDRAIASDISSLLGAYNAVPYSHFLANPQIQPMIFDVQNLRDSVASVNLIVNARFTNYKDSIGNEFQTQLITEDDFYGIGKNPDGTRNGFIDRRQRVTGSYDSKLPDRNNPEQFDPSADSVDVKLTLQILSDDQRDTSRFRFQPIDLRVNDTITRTYRLHDYYAYDDGVAEYSAGLIESGNLIAYQFEMLSGEPDTLIAFDIHFVPFAITSNQTISFYIYHDDGGKPGEVWQSIFSQRIERKGLNEFQRIEWRPALLIDEPRFYIGWKQPVAGKALVGLDTDNDTGDKIFVNTTTTWYQNQVIRGSLMIRPIFGQGEIDTTVGMEEKLNISVYPNPSRGSFYIEGQFDDLEILGPTGEPVSYQADSADSRTEITINKSSGLYLLKIRSGSDLVTEKIVVVR